MRCQNSATVLLIRGEGMAMPGPIQALQGVNHTGAQGSEPK